MQLYNKLLEEDLRNVLKHTEELWSEVRDKTIFITGGTGFFGKWLLESFSFINHELRLNSKMIVLSRNPEGFLSEYPYYHQPRAFGFLKGDVRTFRYPEEEIQYIIHAGTSASDKLKSEDPLLMYDTIIDGTRNMLNLAKEKNVKAFLFTSSGAVYGKQPAELTHIPEDYRGSPDHLNTQSAYGEGKRRAELLCSVYSNQFQVPVKIARCFAFVGPYLPLDRHFAVGNFILNALRDENIVIKGDGTPYRSYLYAADLATWLWTILFRGRVCYPYNVGSEECHSIKEIAYKVSLLSSTKTNIVIQKNSEERFLSERYIPSTSRAKNELKLRMSTNLDDAITRTLAYYSLFKIN
jgi:dTDP-glucose 4,6-dehydratase